MEDRVIRLEERVNYHEKEISEIKGTTKMLGEKLESINSTLRAVKNWIIGAVFLAVAQQLGILNLLKALF
ncbi:hypothetical protein RZR97_08225 [Hydrogenimonas thermophila]|uniref:hypothetical protein n=1 Tax=Hydrogenimonas thermophila TaxID=223786 RepID=UPI0029371E33|nr:hypothetical protein [Hydrogenimonas thermophila]WOE69093.1 hypothetical protein RZR91_08250 [Hydrogenimonas thermophila]WOE71603.1 hypothetical protein RZR97_08225 [Hydrogenimonas thermophila]